LIRDILAFFNGVDVPTGPRGSLSVIALLSAVRSLTIAGQSEGSAGP
jgi:hypothetical protein